MDSLGPVVPHSLLDCAVCWGEVGVLLQDWCQHAVSTASTSGSQATGLYQQLQVKFSTTSCTFGHACCTVCA